MATRRTGQQQRDRRAKLALGVLGLVLVGVLGFEGARALGHKSSAGAETAITASGAAAAGQPAALTLAAASGPTKLARFGGLAAKDPFKAKVSPQTASSAGSAATTTAAASSPPPATTTAPQQTLTISKPPAKKKGPLLPAALLRLNGAKQVVAVGRTFPKDKPMFRLVAVGRSSMWITLLHGSFGGDRMLKVAHGHPAKLVSAGGGQLSFLLALVRVTARHVPPPPPRKPAPPPATTTTFTTTLPTSTAPATTTP